MIFNKEIYMWFKRNLDYIGGIKKNKKSKGKKIIAQVEAPEAATQAPELAQEPVPTPSTTNRNIVVWLDDMKLKDEDLNHDNIMTATLGAVVELQRSVSSMGIFIEPLPDSLMVEDQGKHWYARMAIQISTPGGEDVDSVLAEAISKTKISDFEEV